MVTESALSGERMSSCDLGVQQEVQECGTMAMAETLRRLTETVELQIELAERRKRLAATKYELNVRKGQSWNVHGNRTDKGS